MRTETITIRLPSRVRSELVAEAERTGKTLADHIRTLITTGRQTGAADDRMAGLERRLGDRLSRIEKALSQFEAVD